MGLRAHFLMSHRAEKAPVALPFPMGIHTRQGEGVILEATDLKIN